MAFHVGQKVVCITNWAACRVLYPWVRYPEKGEIYTVRENEFRGEVPGIRLEEIVNPVITHRCGTVGESTFENDAFRPLVESKTDTGMAILKKIAADASKKIPAEAR